MTLVDSIAAGGTRLPAREEVHGEFCTRWRSCCPSRGEKAQLLKWVVQDLGDDFPGIDSQPDMSGGEPCIVRTRIPVWLLEQARRLGTSEKSLLATYPGCARRIWLTPGLSSAHTSCRDRGPDPGQRIRLMALYSNENMPLPVVEDLRRKSGSL